MIEAALDFARTFREWADLIGLAGFAIFVGVALVWLSIRGLKL